MAETTDELTPPRRQASLYEFLVVAPVVLWLIYDLTTRDRLSSSVVVFWILAVIVVDLIPVPAWGGLQLSLSFPILLGVAILYPPATAALIAVLGSVDPRELRREVTLLKALFNRCQIGAAILVASALFHELASATSPWYRLLPVVLLAAIVGYAVNTVLVALLVRFERGIPVRAVLAKMHGATPYEFLVSYIGMGLFGSVIARFYLLEGLWSVAVFLAPLIFARQMYFRSRALADRLAEQNALLAEQASRLEVLLEKEHETVDELREFNRMKGEFVAVVSHELRTPVTALIGYAKTLRQPEFESDESLRAEFLDRMVRQGDRLLRLVENLLTASNLENNQIALTLGRVLFEDACREAAEGLGTDGERIEMNVPADLPILLTDRQLLGRVLSNLLDNALKYSPEGTPCELGARIEDGTLVFWVVDRGVGIPPERLERIFDRFYQVDSSTTRAFRGAGLGLSLARDLLDHLGGTIEVASEPGSGSTFTVRLPVHHAKAAAGPPMPRHVDQIPTELLADPEHQLDRSTG